MKDIKESSKKIQWKDRIPYAFWKGNSYLSYARRILSTCNVTDEQDWNARVYPVVTKYIICQMNNMITICQILMWLKLFVFSIGIMKLDKVSRTQNSKINAHIGN